MRRPSLTKKRDSFLLPRGSQGSAEEYSWDDELEAFLDPYLHNLFDELDEQLADDPDPRVARVMQDARTQLETADAAQGPSRALVNAFTTVLQLPMLRQAAQWTSAQGALGHLAQVGRYLQRGEPDAQQRTVDVRVRERIHTALDTDRPTVVVAHSLGTVVAFEALHEHPKQVALFVTLGSPLATSAVVWQRLRPQPPRTPPTVEKWLNFWDRDDLVVSRPRLKDRFQSNAAGVGPLTEPTHTDGVWVHTATKYLRQGKVAGRIVEALKR